ncbi:hypothetical protein AXK60_11350 [Tsukamurella pseudospumae]|uniref:Uncharacterized protein n=1 Tax=Tsukamurella pseudospumae TaxID=239498 RepID=A0A138A8E8_9ACTN|nr:hypothetical protein AXK60_11350 [Tsukamurella pseudospumae]
MQRRIEITDLRGAEHPRAPQRDLRRLRRDDVLPINPNTFGSRSINPTATSTTCTAAAEPRRSRVEICALKATSAAANRCRASTASR